ncbi:MAG TPA: hypothetical protein VII49_05850 [Rhizomicrobium sp.]
MNIFDFVTQDEIDELSGDANLAFMTFVRHAEGRLAARIERLESELQEPWHSIEEAMHGFMNVVIAAARRYQIEPFASLGVPRHGDFKVDQYHQFRADLDH